MITFDRLWTTMEERGVSQYMLIKKHRVSAGQLGRLKKNMNVSTHTIAMLCKILSCSVEDIIRYIPE